MARHAPSPRYDAPQHPPVLVWSAFPATTRYFAPSASEFMISYVVDDMDAFVARLQTQGVAVLKRTDDDPNGRFAWVLDPEGNKIELWDPNRTAPPDSGAGAPHKTSRGTVLLQRA